MLRKVLFAGTLLIAAVAPAQGMFGGQIPDLDYNPALIMNPAVQKELKLSPEKAQKLQGILMQQGMKMMSLMNSGKNGSKPSEADQKKMAAAALKSLSEMQNKMAAELTPAQRKRFRELTLQSVGPAAVLQPKVSKELGLSSSQKTKLMSAFTKINQKAFTGSSFSRNGKQPTQQDIQNEMKKLEAAQKKSKQESEKALNSVLTASQKKKWNSMLGKRMELGGFAGMGNMFGGAPGRKG